MKKSYWKQSLGLFLGMVIGFLLVGRKQIAWPFFVFSVIFSAFLALLLPYLVIKIPKKIFESPKFLLIFFIVAGATSLLLAYEVFVSGKPMSWQKITALASNLCISLFFLFRWLKQRKKMES